MTKNFAFYKFLGFSSKFLYLYVHRVYYQLYRSYKSLDDRYKLALMNRLIRPGDIVFDLGSHIGFYGVKLANLTGENGQVHTFEPDETNFKFLVKNTRKHPNINNNKCAIGAESGEIVLYQSPYLNVDHRTYDTGENRTPVTVKLIALDDYWKADASPIAFVKMDVEGFEYDALKGMRQILDSPTKPILLTELWPWGLRIAGSSPELVIGFLQDRGYSIFLINDGDRTIHDISSVKQWEYKESIYHDLLCIPPARNSEAKTRLGEFIRG